MSWSEQYEKRTAWKYEPIHGCFHTHEGLINKVDCAGKMLFFPGTTVICRPREGMPDLLSMQARMHELLDETGMLGERLPADSMHMTLHDLVSLEYAEEEYDRQMSESLRKAFEITAAVKELYACRAIVMEADRIVNMVCKSLVLLLKGKTEEDWELLMDLYQRYDHIISFPHAFTPHITLAYFRPGMLDGGRLQQAVNRLQIRSENRMIFTFPVEDIAVQSFMSMKEYRDFDPLSKSGVKYAKSTI